MHHALARISRRNVERVNARDDEPLLAACTTAVLRWTATQDMPDGSGYRSQAVARAMAVLAAHGVDEAAAAPITG